MRKLLTLTLVLCSVVGFAQMRGGALYDPGAARANLSNVDATATPSMTSITLSGKVKAAWADILGDIYASGTVKVSTGTAAAPAYSFASDPNTGVYSPAADNLGVSVAGAEALRVNSAGEVLIATSTDAGDYKLQVNGNVYVTGFTRSVMPNTNTVGAYTGSFINNSSQNTSQHGLYVSVVSGGGSLVNMAISGTSRFNISNNGIVTLLVNQVYADNAAAISGGLSAGNLYRTSDGTLKIVY